MVKHYAQGLTERQAEFIWPPYLLSSTVPGCLACVWNFCTLAFPEENHSPPRMASDSMHTQMVFFSSK